MIGIIGTGWLGKALKEKLERANTLCFGTRSSQDDLPNNIYKYTLGDELPNIINEAATVIVCIPPRLRRKTTLEKEKIIKTHELLFNQLSTNTNLIYTSSTSVYSGKGLMTEDSDCHGSLYEIENLIRNRFKNHLIVRLGGLAGPNRLIVDIISKKGILNNYNLPSNLLHLDDAVAAIVLAIQNNLQGTFNLCSPEHPNKWDVYTTWIKKNTLKPIIKGEPSADTKTIVSDKFINTLNFDFKYKSPLDYEF